MEDKGPARIELPADAEEAPQARQRGNQLLFLAADLVLETVNLAELDVFSAGAARGAEISMFVSCNGEVDGREERLDGAVGITRHILASIKVYVAACDVLPRCSYEALDAPEKDINERDASWKIYKQVPLQFGVDSLFWRRAMKIPLNLFGRYERQDLHCRNDFLLLLPLEIFGLVLFRSVARRSVHFRHKHSCSGRPIFDF